MDSNINKTGNNFNYSFSIQKKKEESIYDVVMRKTANVRALINNYSGKMIKFVRETADKNKAIDFCEKLLGKTCYKKANFVGAKKEKSAKEILLIELGILNIEKRNSKDFSALGFAYWADLFTDYTRGKIDGIYNQFKNKKKPTDFISGHQGYFRFQSMRLSYVLYDSKGFVDKKSIKKVDSIVADVFKNIGKELPPMTEDFLVRQAYGDFYKKVASIYHAAVKTTSNDYMRAKYLQKAKFFNGQAIKIFGTKYGGLVEQKEQIQIVEKRLKTENVFKNIQLTKLSLDFSMENKTNSITRIDGSNGLSAASSEKVNSTLYKYGISAEAVLPITSNFLLFADASLLLQSMTQDFSRTGEQIVLYNEFDIYYKEAISDPMQSKITPIAYNSFSFAFRPYYKGLVNNSIISLDVFGHFGASFDELIPDIRDQKSVGEKYFSHAWKMGGGVKGKIYPFKKIRDLFSLDFNAEAYYKKRFDQNLPNINYRLRTYDSTKDASVDNNVYGSIVNHPDGYFFLATVGINFTGKNIFAGVSAGVTGYNESYYDPLSINNNSFIAPVINAYAGVNIAGDFTAMANYSKKFGIPGHNFGAELRYKNFFVNTSFSLGNVSAYNWATSTSTSSSVGQGASNTDLMKITVGYKKAFNFFE